MKQATININDIVQISPEPGVAGNPMFAGCLMTVTEPKSWGVQGFVQALGEAGKPGGQAYYRAKWEEVEPTGGRAPFVIQ